MFLLPQLIFEKEGVYLHTNAKKSNQDTTIPGFIRIVERVSGVVLRRMKPANEKGNNVVKACACFLGRRARFRVEPPGGWRP